MSSDDKPLKIELKDVKFEDINIYVNENESIKFDLKKWMPAIGKGRPVLNEEESEEEEDNGEDEKMNEEDQKKVESLKKDITSRENKIEELKEKIREIEDKLEMMKKILNIDVSEQQYVKDLSKKDKEEIQA